jgi:uncharacterized protein YjdB
MIKATATGKTNSSRLSVSAPAPIPVATVSVSPASASLQVGASVQLSAVTSDANNNVLTGRVIGWSSSNNGIATVSSSGFVTAIAGGSVSITAASEGQIGSAAIAVSAPAPIPVATVSVSPSTSSLQVGGTVQLSAVTRDANNNVLTGRSITWSSSNNGISTVSASGFITAIAAGTATITALSETKNGTAAITVSAPAPVPVATVSVSPASSTLQIGGTVQLSGVTRDASNNILTGRLITWSSSNNGISTVSASGLVTAIAAGTVVITALSENKNGTAVVVVSAPPVPVASVSVSPAADTLQVGSTGQFSAVTRDANNNTLTGRAITWSSSNTAVATVSQSGLATAVASGSAQIRATSETQIGSATLTVTAPPPPPPPGSGPVWRGNEPTGMTSIDERSFNSLGEDPAWGSMGSPGATIVADATAPKSPSNVLSINFPAGFSGGGSPEHSSIVVPDYRVLYLSYWIKHSANWWGHSSGVNKHIYVWQFDNNPSFYAEAEGVGSGPLRPRLALQPGEVVVNPNSSGWYDTNLVPGAVFTRGQWDYVEIVLTGNTSGNRDGVLDMYLNGVHVTHYAGFQYSSGTTRWNYARIYPVWGGIGDVLSAAQSIQWDHIYMSGKQ